RFKKIATDAHQDRASLIRSRPNFEKWAILRSSRCTAREDRRPCARIVVGSEDVWKRGSRILVRNNPGHIDATISAAIDRYCTGPKFVEWLEPRVPVGGPVEASVLAHEYPGRPGRDDTARVDGIDGDGSDSCTA